MLMENNQQQDAVMWSETKRNYCYHRNVDYFTITGCHYSYTVP